MFMFLRIERPTTATLRPDATATSIACCIRWMFEANDETSTRPVRCGISWRNASPTTRSERGVAGDLGVRRVAEHDVDAAVADLGELADVGAAARRPACGRASSRRCGRRGPRRSRTGSRRSRGRSAPSARTRAGTARAAPARASGSASRSSAARSEAVLVELRLDEPERQPRRPDLVDLHLAQQVRQRADVVLVRVRQHDRADPCPVAQVREVRQDQVDAEVLVAREREPGVDDDRSRRRSRRRSCSCRPRRGRRGGRCAGRRRTCGPV